MRRNDDPSIVPYVLHGMAQALLGQGATQEALGYAQSALQRAPAQSQQEFATTLQHAQRGAPLPRKAAPPSEGAFDALRANDPKATLDRASKLAGDARASRAALTAARYRFPSDNDVPFARAGVDAAWSTLQSAAGTTDRDAAIALHEADRTLRAALFGIDVPPPLGASMTREAFLARFGGAAAGAPPAQAIAQAQAAQQAVQAGTAGDMDPVVFPNQPFPRLSDYVRIMKALQSGNPVGGLTQLGLTMQAYGPIAMRWTQAMQRDPTLVAKFQRLMTT